LLMDDLGRGRIVTSSPLSALEKCCGTSFYPGDSLWEIHSHPNCHSLHVMCCFSLTNFKIVFSLTLIFRS
jgi:hypothetical protein